MTLDLTPEDPDEVPERPCTANLSLANNPPCLKEGAQVAATHIITGLDGRSQWWGCEKHTAEALEAGCTAEPWDDWYRRNILKEPMSWDEYLETMKGPAGGVPRG